MRWTSTCFVVAIAMIANGCGAGETRIDPGDLELSDLLGVAPEVAIEWDAEQRASARRVLATALDDDAIDALEGAAKPTPTLVLANEWDNHTWSALPDRGTSLLAALAADAGHRNGRLVIAPGPRAPAISTYEDGKLVVNPVVLAAIEPSTNERATSEQLERVVPAVSAPRTATPSGNAYAPVTPEAVTASGNPYSFYGSVAECAFAQRARCESCVSSNTCDPITDSDGTTECNRLAESNGRGYYLICINLALAISSVENCAIEKASSCPRDTNASDSLAELENNANFLDTTCQAPLDACLGEIYGPPPEVFPGLDGGVTPPREPRNTSIDCGEGCSSNNNNCEASPNCDCSGPSCNNSFSCDSTCANSNSGNTNCGNCDSCDSNGGGGGGGGGGGCDSSSSGGGGNCSGGGCGSGGNCSGGDCGGGSCGGGGDCGGGGNSCNSGGGGGSCNVTKQRESSRGFALVFSIGWAFAPLPVALMVRRRSRKRRRAVMTDAAIGMKGEEVAS